MCSNMISSRSNVEVNQVDLKCSGSLLGLHRRAPPEVNSSPSAATFSRGRTDDVLRSPDMEFWNKPLSPINWLTETTNRRRSGWSLSRRVSEFTWPDNDDDSSATSEDMLPPSVRSLVWENTSVTVVLGGKTSRTIQFTKLVILASDILERLSKMLYNTDYEKFNLPSNISQIRLTRKDQLLQSEDEVMDGDVIYAFAKSELTRGVSVDDEKHSRISRPKRDINEILEMLNPARQRHLNRKQPLFYTPPFGPEGKVDDSEDVFSGTADMEIASKPCPLKYLSVEMTQKSMNSNDFMKSEVMLKGLKTRLQKLEHESKNIKNENEELRNKVRETTNSSARERKKLIEMEFNWNRKKNQVSNLTARNEELLRKNKRLLDERCSLEKNVQNLEVQLENERKQDGVMGMGVELPKDIPKSQEKLEKTIDALENLIRKLRSLQVEHYKSRMTCIICYDRKWNTALIPCGHCLCEVCARRVTSCPQCRQSIKRRQRMPMQAKLPTKIVV